MTLRPALLIVLLALVGTATAADTVDVRWSGVVEFNLINSGPFADVEAGDSVVATFQVDSDVFTDSVNFPTRGYDVDQSSFSLVLGSVQTVLQDPFPGGQTPYFVLRDDDPAVDGFWLSTNVDFPLGVPTDVPGAFGQFVLNTQVTYEGETLSSLDILDALGTYDFTGLTVFHFTIDDGPFEAMGMLFEELTLTTGPALAIGGTCPGVVTFDVSGATPSSLVTLFSGTGGGTSTVPGGPCAGVRLPIGDPSGRRSINTDAEGNAHFERDLENPSVCDATIVVVDRSTCAVSNPADMP